MSSAVHFRFKSARDFDTVTFDGDFISIADLKVGIVEVKKLNYGEGFDLDISDAQTSDDYADEAYLLPKNTSVVVRRVPGLKPGGILSQQAMAKKNERYSEIDKRGHHADRAPTPGPNYVCHRCGKPGHWIDQCPTNGDPTFDKAGLAHRGVVPEAGGPAAALMADGPPSRHPTQMCLGLLGLAADAAAVVAHSPLAAVATRQ
ncbi:hypothetical protein I4F81_001017 [Pyropia yezoensis]|uniref:Uncharacterized protein n=1 Tax=Pyropia yezoensis TaxID=2788 RepID=A0ACC3BKS0_PYRYE|nr:hypothetical protein I4F81_001017 [Neopyropia yezoensis]